MPDDLLENARQQAKLAESSIRGAALLRIARAESAADVPRARRTLLEGLDIIRNLPSSRSEHLLGEARGVAAVSIPGRCFTKQTGDMVYTMAENSWLSQLWLDA
jgi:hypothetical protein